MTELCFKQVGWHDFQHKPSIHKVVSFQSFIGCVHFVFEQCSFIAYYWCLRAILLTSQIFLCHQIGWRKNVTCCLSSDILIYICLDFLLRFTLFIYPTYKSFSQLFVDCICMLLNLLSMHVTVCMCVCVCVCVVFLPLILDCTSMVLQNLNHRTPPSIFTKNHHCHGQLISNFDFFPFYQFLQL